MLKDLSKIKSSQQIELINNVRSGIPTAAFGVTQGEKIRIASILEGSICYIAPDYISCKAIAQELESIQEKEVLVLPPKNDVLLPNSIVNKEILHKRIECLYKISKKSVNFVTTVEALLQLVPKVVHSVLFKVGESISFSDISQQLVSMGYKRVEFIQDVAEFSIRGDVIDIYPIAENKCYRVDCCFDEIEKITTIDIETGEKGEKFSEVTVLQAYDYYIPDENLEEISTKLDNACNRQNNLNLKGRLRNLAYELKEELNNGYSDKLNVLLPIFNSVGTILNALKDYTIIYDEGKLIDERASGLLKEHNERFIGLSRRAEVFDFAINQLQLKDFLFSKLNELKTLSLQNLSSKINFYNPLKTYRYNTSSIANYSLNPQMLIDDCKTWVKNGYNVLICCGEQVKVDNLSKKFADNCLVVSKINNFDNFNKISLTSEYLGKGFIEHDNKLVVIGSTQIFIISSKKKELSTKKFTSFKAPQVGDYAVHESYGIGRVVGTKRIATLDETKDYLELEYRDGDRLYIPLDKMDRLSKYLGGEENPKLNKLFNGEFERVREKVKESISQMSIDLRKLYKARKERKGFVFSPDDEFSLEFDNAFEYELTEDQVTAITEIKDDMESNKIMDRLICGDVGFGKTEVAMRACFKAVMDKKQVAVVCPTTILSQQHYNTFVKRFDGFDIKIEVLNRFKTPSEKVKILDRLLIGDIDIIIGTHALFGKNVKFDNLGLLVLDEEQRFGVEHKEKIKTLKENVDAITLTATPIPRTLHMSLIGIRDISEINTPPKQRIPTQTFVVEQTDTVIVDAIEKELARGGQVNILYNRVDNIENFANYIRELIPQGKIMFAHGQMPERELEDRVISFFNGEFNILIATTIIENGIDLPNANTLIVIDSDKLGLSTLYQLRGRVGRSNKMAYAYFTYREKVLTEASYKRLNALMEYSDIGSGYKIALRDLEIRGAGNVLGREQHGNMLKIGYELYSKLLKEKLSNNEYEKECEVDCKVTAYLPDTYVDYPQARMDCYKRIAQISSLGEKEKIQKELKKVFGEIPIEVENLINIAYLKVLCKKFDIIKAEVRKDVAKLFCKNLNSLQNRDFADKIEGYEHCSLTIGDTPCIIFNKKVFNGEERLLEVITFLS